MTIAKCKLHEITKLCKTEVHLIYLLFLSFFLSFADNIVALKEKVFEKSVKIETLNGILGLQKVLRKLFPASHWTL